ncbi:hypothetical protein Pcaca01_36080 [Pectobacterium carotovorum subsp. carotovorum]|nr:hypothetical protein Pcaca01_36080 [Pectobacterium carotovorum subsp. carotovorum]
MKNSYEHIKLLPKDKINSLFQKEIQGVAKLFFSVKLWGATSSIAVMKMLAEQAEANISRALSDADKPGGVEVGEFPDERYHEDGSVTMFQRTYYSCGSCVGYDQDEVRSTYKHLIAQLTRRSTFLTIFGLFEHRMVDCLELMDDLSCKTTDKKHKTVEDCHNRLKDNFGGKNIKDVDHLAVIRNIMAHSDGVADNYKILSCKQTKKTETEKRLLRAISRAMTENAGISITVFNDVLMDARFLMYAVSEFERYVDELNIAVRTYQTQVSSTYLKSI